MHFPLRLRVVHEIPLFISQQLHRTLQSGVSFLWNTVVILVFIDNSSFVCIETSAIPRGVQKANVWGLDQFYALVNDLFASLTSLPTLQLVKSCLMGEAIKWLLALLS